MRTESILDGVEDTLYIPLAGRIYASKNFPDFFYDEKALSLEPLLPAENIEKNSSEYSYMASVCRQQTIDKKIIRFLEKSYKANVVFLGAGLETAYHRIGNQTANFYQVDLPEVIEIRKKVLGQGCNEKLISGDMFRLHWIQEIDTTLPTLISAAGVYQYFHESEIIEMIQSTKAKIPYGELVFDATNSKGLRFANQYVKKTGNANAQMHFSVDDPREFAMRTSTELIEVDGFFQSALKECHGLHRITRIYMYFADRWKRTLVLHFGFS